MRQRQQQEDDAVRRYEVGKHADFVLLTENPLADIRHTRNVAGVFTQNRWHTKQNLDEMLIEAKAIVNSSE